MVMKGKGVKKNKKNRKYKRIKLLLK